MTDPDRFTAQLASWQRPTPFLGPLGHLVADDGPAGFVHGLIRPAGRPTVQRASGPDLALRESRPTKVQRWLRALTAPLHGTIFTDRPARSTDAPTDADPAHPATDGPLRAGQQDRSDPEQPAALSAESAPALPLTRLPETAARPGTTRLPVTGALAGAQGLAPPQPPGLPALGPADAPASVQPLGETASGPRAEAGGAAPAADALPLVAPPGSHTRAEAVPDVGQIAPTASVEGRDGHVPVQKTAPPLGHGSAPASSTKPPAPSPRSGGNDDVPPAVGAPSAPLVGADALGRQAPPSLEAPQDHAPAGQALPQVPPHPSTAEMQPRLPLQRRAEKSAEAADIGVHAETSIPAAPVLWQPNPIAPVPGRRLGLGPPVAAPGSGKALTPPPPAPPPRHSVQRSASSSRGGTDLPLPAVRGMGLPLAAAQPVPPAVPSTSPAPPLGQAAGAAAGAQAGFTGNEPRVGVVQEASAPQQPLSPPPASDAVPHAPDPQEHVLGHHPGPAGEQAGAPATSYEERRTTTRPTGFERQQETEQEAETTQESPETSEPPEPPELFVAPLLAQRAPLLPDDSSRQPGPFIPPELLPSGWQTLPLPPAASRPDVAAAAFASNWELQGQASTPPLLGASGLVLQPLPSRALKTAPVAPGSSAAGRRPPGRLPAPPASPHPAGVSEARPAAPGAGRAVAASISSLPGTGSSATTTAASGASGVAGLPTQLLRAAAPASAWQTSLPAVPLQRLQAPQLGSAAAASERFGLPAGDGGHRFAAPPNVPPAAPLPAALRRPHATPTVGTEDTVSRTGAAAPAAAATRTQPVPLGAPWPAVSRSIRPGAHPSAAGATGGATSTLPLASTTQRLRPPSGPLRLPVAAQRLMETSQPSALGASAEEQPPAPPPPPAPPSPVAGTPQQPAEPGSGEVGGGASGSPERHGEHDLDDLARRLYPRISRRIKAELRLDRERLGVLLDGRR